MLGSESGPLGEGLCLKWRVMSVTAGYSMQSLGKVKRKSHFFWSHIVGLSLMDPEEPGWLGGEAAELKRRGNFAGKLTFGRGSFTVLGYIFRG
jgi:hypothetical protein